MTHKTVICHFYNEEYLLPWWLKHHRKIFDHGIMIDYRSTDRSREIIEQMCPSWVIVPTRNSDFDILNIDEEITDLETRFITSWRMVLNVTEYLVGDYSILDHVDPDIRTEITVGCNSLVEKEFGSEYDPNLDIFDQCKNGFTYQTTFQYRAARAIRNYTDKWPYGRHFHHVTTDAMVVYHGGFAPWNEKALRRRMQITPRVSQRDINTYGMNNMQHLYDLDHIMEYHKKHVNESYDISEDIQRRVADHIKALGFR